MTKDAVVVSLRRRVVGALVIADVVVCWCQKLPASAAAAIARAAVAFYVYFKGEIYMYIFAG